MRVEEFGTYLLYNGRRTVGTYLLYNGRRTEFGNYLTGGKEIGTYI
jgi:hypothetical protein